MSDHYQRIKEKYQGLQGDSTGLFQEILAASHEIGMDRALAYLEQCVVEKRLAWLRANRNENIDESDLLTEGYKWFYEKYLRVSVPKDGEIVEESKSRMVMRWRNPCPTLAACTRLGLDTREVCKKVYERPVQEFLRSIHPRLRFERDYRHIRPHAGYCEEIITLEE